MLLSDIVRQNIMFVASSGVSVEVNTSFETVEIKDNEGSAVFLQGDDARNFISAAEDIYNNPEVDISMQDAYEYQAYDYLDLLSEG